MTSNKIPESKFDNVLKNMLMIALDVMRINGAEKTQEIVEKDFFYFPFDSASRANLGYTEAKYQEEFKSFIYLKRDIEYFLHKKNNINARARSDSYLTIIAALSKKKIPLDINSPGAVSSIKTEIEKIGLSLGEDTIRKIVKEVRDIIDK